MTVQELIEELEDCDPDAQVILLTQRNYPFENSLIGVVVREDVERAGGDVHDDDGETEREAGTSANDVFLLEGQQLRYGSGGAWAASGRG